LPTPRLAPYTFWMANHTFTKPIRLIQNLKIHIHGIPYVVTFIVMHNIILDSSYSMLLWWPWLHNAKVTHDWGNNLITIEGNGIFGLLQTQNTWMETLSHLRYFFIMISWMAS
jgi:hypothetical protein